MANRYISTNSKASPYLFTVPLNNSGGSTFSALDNDEILLRVPGHPSGLSSIWLDVCRSTTFALTTGSSPTGTVQLVYNAYALTRDGNRHSVPNVATWALMGHTRGYNSTSRQFDTVLLAETTVGNKELNFSSQLLCGNSPCLPGLWFEILLDMSGCSSTLFWYPGSELYVSVYVAPALGGGVA